MKRRKKRNAGKQSRLQCRGSCEPDKLARDDKEKSVFNKRIRTGSQHVLHGDHGNGPSSTIAPRQESRVVVEKTRAAKDAGDFFGDAYTFVAIERTSKLIVAWHLGKRTVGHT